MPDPSPRDACTLVLVPTTLERGELDAQGGFPLGLARVETCGLGPVAAAARTSALLERLRPARALLVGIAGAYDVRAHPIGTAARCGVVSMDGLEACGFDLLEAQELPRRPAIGTRIELAGANAAVGLVTVLAPSGSADEAGARRARHEGAALEDMEGFGVALACAAAGVPLAIARGVSNAAGDRSRERWKIPEALAAARAIALEILRAAVPDGRD
jgi:futalosine hydrolase